MNFHEDILKVVSLTLWLDFKLHSRGHVVYLTMIQVRSGTGVDTSVILLHTREVTSC